MTITYHDKVVQGSDEWIALRCGVLTASEMKLILTPTLKMASNEKERQHLYEMVAQTVTKYVEPHYISDDMMRGQEEEIDARIAYEKNYAKIDEVGFVTNDDNGYVVGYSPDGLVGDKGLVEFKSRRQKYQIETILNGIVPDEHIIQVQTGLFVTKRDWLDFGSYCGGLPMVTMRVFPDPKIQEAILQASGEFHKRMGEKLARYQELLKSDAVRLIPTQRKIELEMTI